MRRLSADGVSYRSIAAELTRRELPPRNGREWHPGTIQSIVERDKKRRLTAKNGAAPSRELAEVTA
jgi:hypothetical protein